MSKHHRDSGFTIIELVVVIILLGILAATALPRFVNMTEQAKVAALEGIAGTMYSTIQLVKMKAYSQGITPSASNPGDQSAYIVDFGDESSEIDFRNLCPESEAELGDQLTMIDFISLTETEKLTAERNNQYTLVGFEIPGFSVPTNEGCYVIYDSFGSPDCTVTLVTVDC